MEKDIEREGGGESSLYTCFPSPYLAELRQYEDSEARQRYMSSSVPMSLFLSSVTVFAAV